MVVFGACAPWTPSDFPVRVDVGADLNDAQRVALLDGIALLEERVGANVFAPVESNGRRIQRGRISVRDGVKQHGYDGWAHRNPWSCQVTLRRDVYATLALHELLHCLGLDHDDGTGDSVMDAYAGSVLTRQHIDHVRGLMGLGPSALPEVPEVVSPELPNEDVRSDDGNENVPAETDDAGTEVIEPDAGTEVVEDAGVALPDFTIPNIRVNLGATGGAQ